MKIKPPPTSFMQLCLHMDSGPLYLKVPTFFDRTKKEWMGFVHLQKAKKMIYGKGKTSKELEQNFNDNLRESLESEHSQETFELFKPLSYWEEMEE
jgi:tripartite-type tricarboxylate transporter receptor subunit TctC